MLSWTTLADSCRIRTLAAGINIWARSSWYIQWDDLTCISINVNWLTAVTWGHRCLSQIDLQKYTLKRIYVYVYIWKYMGVFLLSAVKFWRHAVALGKMNIYIYIYMTRKLPPYAENIRREIKVHDSGVTWTGVRASQIIVNSKLFNCVLRPTTQEW